MKQIYIDLLEKTKQYAIEYVESINQKPPYPPKSDLVRLEEFDEPLPKESVEALAVIDLLHGVGSAGTTAQIGGRYFGFVNGGLLPVAHAAGWLADTWNQNSALYSMSPVVSRLENLCERWIIDILGLEKDTAMGLVTGSANAMICAFAAARNELLKRQGYDLTENGLRNAPPIRIVIGEEAHSTVKSALSIIGIGRNEVEVVPTDDFGRMKMACIPELDKHTLLILQAGNVCGGAYDPIRELCGIANSAGAWIHIDGAFGMWAAASRKYRYLVDGFEKADSYSLDAHKTLNAGYDCGIVLCRHRNALTKALQASGSYIQYSENRDGMLYTTEMSRRARAVSLWAVLKQLGSNGVEELINQLCSEAEYFAEELSKLGLTVVNSVFFNQFMLKADTPAQTTALLRSIQNSGICWCGSSEWQGEPVIRISVCSHATMHADIDLCVFAFQSALQQQESMP